MTRCLPHLSLTLALVLAPALAQSDPNASSPPASPSTPTPAPARPPVPLSRSDEAALANQPAPISLVFEAPLRVVERGEPGVANLRLSLDLSSARVAALQAKGGFSDSLAAEVKAFLASIPATPQNAHFEQFSDGWALVQRDGYRVDADAATAALKAALARGAKGAQALNVAVVYQTLIPARTLDYFVSKGITSHLGTGETTYYGSSAARMTNIHAATRQFQDRLVSDAVFSFNRTVGPVSRANGFVPGLVIAGERTATGLGGGICQVSTTVFRALYAAGFPIVERRNHSYQVHYYDPQGLDATIYQPTQDLRFQNSSGGALWFQAEWDDSQHSLAVHVFGRPQGYTVEVGTPRVLSSTPPPPDRVLSDPSLPARQRVQVDWAAPGATIAVTRTLRRPDGSVLRQDTLKSVYRPWPNIYTVGTRR